MSREPWKPDVAPSAPGLECEDPAPPYAIAQSMACSSQSALFNQPAPPYSAPQVNMGYGQGSSLHYAAYQPPSYYALPQAGAASSSTTVIIQQPQPMVGPNGRRLWSTKLCDCCKDTHICCFGTFCYPCLACQVSTDMGESLCVPCCVNGWLTALRTKMRTEQNIAGSVLDDCFTAYFCFPCVLCQLSREIKICRNSGNMRV